METFITIDDSLLEAAKRHSGESEINRLVELALTTYIQTKPVAVQGPAESQALRPWPMTPPRPMSPAESFSKIEFFAELSEAEIAQLLAASKSKIYNPGDLLIQRGDGGDSMFVITHGYVEVLVGQADQPDAEIAVAKLREGEFFGEMSLLTGAPRSATIRAITTVRANEISKEAFRGVLQTRPELLGVISRIIAERRLHLKLAEEDSEAKTRKGSEQLLERMRAFFGA